MTALADIITLPVRLLMYAVGRAFAWWIRKKP